MLKKLLIRTIIVFSAIIMTWTVFYFVFPVIIIDETAYNKIKINNLIKQRESEYNELYASLNTEIIHKIENDKYFTDIKNFLEKFYIESIYIDETYSGLMNNCRSKVKFPLQKKSICSVNEIFLSCINVIEYNSKYYNEFAVKLLMEYYDEIVKNIIDKQTHQFIEYIDDNLYNSRNDIYEYNYNIAFNENIFDNILKQCLITGNLINKLNIKLSDIFNFDIPVIEIDNINYSLAAVNELQNSMEITSSYILDNFKYILINGVNRQTEIYSNNIDKYIDWYYSFFTGIDRGISNIIGFFTGVKSAEEQYYFNNFNRIMNNNANIDDIIVNDMFVLNNIIYELFYEYFNLLNFMLIDNKQARAEIIINEEIFIEPYISDIVLYIGHVFEALENENNYFLQDYTIKNNAAVGAAMTTAKVLSNFSLLGSLAMDYLTLQTQRILNSSELRQQLFNKMIENQNVKIEIINDPFNYLFNRLHIGSVVFVDQYFAGLNAFQHYGIYIGNEKVIHFAPAEGQELDIFNLQESFDNAVIHETTLENFLKGRALQIDMNIKPEFSEQEIVQRAKSRLGEKNYNLLLNNCEHLARWCVTGEHVSYQINNLPQKIDSTILILRDSVHNITKFFELFN